ncbi:beta-galactosidase [Streptomyces sp. NPDC088350]|uniref:beta-galactosidase n=1 Tax=Streptomyces sp. NPDC088350 TaxID=3365854 RepID=UPI0037F5D12F
MLPRLDRLAFGADYYPEQWPEEVWKQDVRLMQEAGVNLLSVGIFSWALVEHAPGDFHFEWLDRVMDLLAEAGIKAALATPTAGPPAWFIAKYPQARPVTADGRVLGIGARESYCPSSPEFRDAAARVTGAFAERYRDHSALAVWHSHNEYGAHVKTCYCDRSTEAFRDWLANRYGTLEELNEAWGTTFWSQRYFAWSEIQTPRIAPMPVNSAQKLDFMRFTTDEYLACYLLERDILRAATPDVPVTTNLMAGAHNAMDYWRWAPEMDLIGSTNYLMAEQPRNHLGLSLSGDLSRSFAYGRPWLLMEHSTGAVNWQNRNIAKLPGQMRCNSLTHIARGADGVMFFQWRASRFGSEKFHSAMIPQAGTDSALWRDVVALGNDVRALGEVRGTRVKADVAVVFDYESWWAMEFEDKPIADLAYGDGMQAFYEALWNQNLTVDFVKATDELGHYPLVLLPSLYLLSREGTENLTRYAEAGGTLLVSYFSGIVDENDRIHEGPFPGGLRDVLGLTTEEFHPLYVDQTVDIDGSFRGDYWSERVVLRGAESVLAFRGGPDQGHPALTRNTVGNGAAWYLATRLDPAALERVLNLVREQSPAIPHRPEIPAQVESVTRVGDGVSYRFLINHGTAAAAVPAVGTDLLSGERYEGSVLLQPFGVVVLRTPEPVGTGDTHRKDAAEASSR